MNDEVLASRWAPLSALQNRPSRFGIETGALSFGADFEAAPDVHDMAAGAKILCVGAGGLGCEILKDLALTGFTDIHVIDLDTIDVTNLNRQFLFRKKDVGQPKATVAAAFINARVPGCVVTPHFGKLQDFEPEWYRQFNCVVAGLDNVEARRWLNQVLCGLVSVDPEGVDGEVDMMTVIPLIDGGTEGFKGQARVILPLRTSCFECTMNMFPPAQTKAVCTLENNPRVASDCAIYVFMKIDDDEAVADAAASGVPGALASFSQNEQVEVSMGDGTAPVAAIVLANENGGVAAEAAAGGGARVPAAESAMVDDAATGGQATYRLRLAGGVVRGGVPAAALASIRQMWVADFGADAKVDKDSRVHMTWIHERAAARAALFNIAGLTYDKTLGAVKNIIPAVASTNAVIAAACVHEAYKCLTFSGQLCNTYMLYNGQSMGGGVSCDTLKFERDPECMHCQDTKEKRVAVGAPGSLTVRQFVDRFVLAPGALNLATVVPGKSLPLPREPMVYGSDGDCFFCTTGALAAFKAGNLDRPLSDLVDEGEVVFITDATWGANPKRALRVSFTA